MKIIGFINFEPALYVSADLLGERYAIKIADQAGFIQFPSLPPWKDKELDPLHMFLVAPEQCSSWMQGEFPIYWGKPHSYPSGESLVHKAYIEFEISDLQLAQAIYGGFAFWKQLFYQYVQVLTTQGTDNHVTVIHQTHNIELFEESTSLVRVTDEKMSSFAISISAVDESLHRDQLVLCLNAASSGKSLRIEYRLLLNSLVARGKEDYRMAIIDAANAVEICLHSKIKQECKAIGIDFADELLKKYSMLGGKIELAKLLGVLPKKDFSKTFTEPRNDVMHKAFFPDKIGANKMINEVTKLLRELQPDLCE